MSSFITVLKNPKTGKAQKAWAIDDYFGQHQYGYFFRKNGKDVSKRDFTQLNKPIYDIFNKDEIE